MKRSAFIIACFTILIAVSFAFISADEPRYKNLKVLKKDISKEELDSVMHFFSMSVGERCGFCHVWNEAAKTMDFVSDDNPQKNIARYMMRMNAKINKKYFTNKEQKSEQQIQAVTCYTCHHGAAIPAVKAQPMRRDSAGPPPAMSNPPGSPATSAKADSARQLPTDSAK